MKSFQEIMDEMNAQQAKAREESNSTRNELRTKLLAAGISRVAISFSGGGDSGCIDNIEIEYADGCKSTPTFSEETLRKELSNWADVYLEGTGIDWYNNDGGQGMIEFDLNNVPFKFSAHVDVNHTVSETAHSEEEIF